MKPIPPQHSAYPTAFEHEFTGGNVRGCREQRAVMMAEALQHAAERSQDWQYRKMLLSAGCRLIEQALDRHVIPQAPVFE